MIRFAKNHGTIAYEHGRKEYMDIHRVAILAVDDLGDQVMVYHLAKPADFSWHEGAHVHLALPGFNAGSEPNRDLVRHMSILSLVEENEIAVITRLDSSDSLYKRTLATLTTGDELFLFKVGSALHLKRDGRPVVILTMGVAVGALRPLAQCYARDQEGIPALHSITVNHRADYPFRAELEALTVPHLKLEHVTGRAAYREALAALSLASNPWFLIVGSDNFLQESILTLQARGVAPSAMEVDLKPAKRDALLARLGIGDPA